MMNERIRKLEAQCWEATKYGPPWFDSKKFAELIVRECANIAETAEPYQSHDLILGHFGVENERTNKKTC
jgi:hypothetical protein